MRNDPRLLLACVWLLAGCGASVSYAELKPAPARAPRPFSAVPIYNEGEEPPCVFDVAGTLAVQSEWRLGSSRAESLKLLRERAGTMGADGLGNLRCANPGEVGYDGNACNADVIFCRK